MYADNTPKRLLIPSGKEIVDTRLPKHPIPEGVKAPKYGLMQEVLYHWQSEEDTFTDEARIIGIMFQPQIIELIPIGQWMYLIEYEENGIVTQTFAQESRIYRRKPLFSLWQQVRFYERTATVIGFIFGGNPHHVPDIGNEWGWVFLIEYEGGSGEKIQQFAHEDELYSASR
ncbi:hypothetical protein NDI37_25565 [Funiculus sociatus GB2-A5]|uniref:Uncharacterized protein n=1 Tax=Funiculus sociatus GB2-A5 TaxID=2933946 RepID=A0ABV0JWQ8_9CYAN|nr:hypothetical protein [Trichocoleus sp. FACHB-6]MBD2060692.1 hypothetical protein [Trichocoleus sp. FACHB-6]